LENSVFWDIMRCSPVEISRPFGVTYRLYVQCRIASQARNQHETGSNQLCWHMLVKIETLTVYDRASLFILLSLFVTHPLGPIPLAWLIHLLLCSGTIPSGAQERPGKNNRLSSHYSYPLLDLLSANNSTRCLLNAVFIFRCFCSTLKVDARCSSKTSVDFHRTTPHYNPEYIIFRSYYRCENLNLHIAHACTFFIFSEWRWTLLAGWST
jgi:hypothetical protein